MTSNHNQQEHQQVESNPCDLTYYHLVTVIIKKLQQLGASVHCGLSVVNHQGEHSMGQFSTVYAPANVWLVHGDKIRKLIARYARYECKGFPTHKDVCSHDSHAPK